MADELVWAATYNAAYIALPKLQADALVTLDRQLARSAERLVHIAPIEPLEES